MNKFFCGFEGRLFWAGPSGVQTERGAKESGLASPSHRCRRKIVEKSKIPRVANPPEWHSPPPYLTFDLTFRCTPPTATPGTGPGGASPRTVPRRRPSRSVKITLSCVTTKSRVDPRDSEHHNTQDAISGSEYHHHAAALTLGIVDGQATIALLGSASLRSPEDAAGRLQASSYIEGSCSGPATLCWACGGNKGALREGAAARNGDTRASRGVVDPPRKEDGFSTRSNTF
ncbi:hypothetical protein TcasGA2_TC013965 [Tribolium castaneum]|uniref:Uncharacterized protein n=1 Tax=Tribolium castaneum TaxID=7070 RepID=D6WNT1_TRICA|nr:hypothetical protein TcasGA2_TC013965 [Tribolium castaneum]